MNVYKPCDIRGTIDHLSPAQYQSWGRCIGRRVTPGTVVYIGGDVRTHTPDLLNALEQGLVEAGSHVRNLGIVPTPMVYFANRAFGSGTCAIVTASHNPPHYNGLKWMIDNEPPSHEQVEQFRIETEQPITDHREAGTCEPADVEADYIDWLKNRFGRELQGFHVVVDPGCGCWSQRATRYLQNIFPGLTVTAIHDEPDGTFPKRNPDSAKPAHLTALCKTVTDLGANLGLAFDGDGDRVAYVDHEGVALTAEQATFVLLHAMAKEATGKPFIYDIKFSDAVANAAHHVGATPQPQRSGHAFIRAAMRASGAAFGAEISGHYFYGELDGSDDGLFSALQLIAYLAETNQTLAQLRADCPTIHMTGDLRVTLEAAQCDEAIALAQKAFANQPQSTLDGVRIDFDDGWALMRQSVTEAAMTFRFEGHDAAALDRVVERYCAKMDTLGQQLLEQYRT